MRMNFLNDALGRVPEYRAIENAVRQRKTPVAVTGVASIHKANILHTLLSAMSKKALFIAGDEAHGYLYDCSGLLSEFTCKADCGPLIFGQHDRY